MCLCVHACNNIHAAMAGMNKAFCVLHCRDISVLSLTGQGDKGRTPNPISSRNDLLAESSCSACGRGETPGVYCYADHGEIISGKLHFCEQVTLMRGDCGTSVEEN